MISNCASRTSIRVARMLAGSTCAVALLAAAGNASAQAGPDAATVAPDDQNAIIVTGTRRAERTVADSAAPVDVVSANDLTNSTPSPDLNDKLARLVPSFNISRLPNFDGATFVRPATLRGLSPDQTLVLINGKRRHRSAFINTALRGSQGADLAQIPQIALSRVEVLRDGASAQYGSDAIAGVINLLLDDKPGFSADAQAGQYYAGDGESYQVAAKAGVKLGDRGVVVISGEYNSMGMTDRGTAAQKIGQPLIKAWRLFGNAKYSLTDDAELYAFGNYNGSRSRIEFNYRSPQNGIYNRSYYQDNAPFLYPDYDLADIYPNGFIPIYRARSKDSSLVAGVRGHPSESFNWDLSGRYGRNRNSYSLGNSINASLGPVSPTSFYVGSEIQTDYAVNADFTWLIDAGLFRPISFSFGGEWRKEQYETQVGDEAAYIVGPLADLPPGANGHPSQTPDQAGRWSRDSRAAYVDIDVDVTERFNFGTALRFEDFDQFGSTWNYKVSGRYKATPWLSLRASMSTGFHAPTLGQQNYTATSQGPDVNNPPPAPQVILTSGLIPSTSPIAAAVGGKPLVPEKATSFGGGLVLTPASGLTISADYYNIKIRDRLGITSTLTLTQAQRDALVAQGVSQAAQLANFQFFINGYDTRTQGIDVVAAYTTRAGAGKLSLTAALNYNKSKLTGGDPKIVNGNLKQEVEQLLPHKSANVGAEYQLGRLGLSVRGRYTSSFIDALPYFAPSDNQRYGSEIFVDVAASFAVTPAVKITVGADNLFDNYPDRNRGPFSFLGNRNPVLGAIEGDGGRYYARVSARF